MWKDIVPLAVNNLGRSVIEAEDEHMSDNFNHYVSGEKTEGGRDPLVSSATIQTLFLFCAMCSCIISLLPTDSCLGGHGPR